MNRLPARASLAALLVLAVLCTGVWLLLRMSLPGRGNGPPPIRPITLESVPHDGPVLLAWEGGSPPFRVQLLGTAGDILWESPTVPRPLLVLPGPVRDRLLPGESYSWVVEGRDLGDRVYRSGRFSLTILPPPGLPRTEPG